MSNNLNPISKYHKIAVNIRDVETLTALQTCCGELFKNALDVLAADKYYEINNDDGKDLQ